jgi:hypothetical protein
VPPVLSGPRVLWSVRAARGALHSISTCPRPPGTAAGPPVATAAADGLRLWGPTGKLLQSVEGVRLSDLATCPEGLVGCQSTGQVSLYPWL